MTEIQTEGFYIQTSLLPDMVPDDEYLSIQDILADDDLQRRHFEITGRPIRENTLQQACHRGTLLSVRMPWGKRYRLMVPRSAIVEWVNNRLPGVTGRRGG